MKPSFHSRFAHRALKSIFPAASAWFMTQACASAAVIKHLEFNALPTSTSEGLKFSGNSNAFTINNGILEQRTIDLGGNNSYFFPGLNEYVNGNGPPETLFDSNLPIVLETRLQILDIQGTGGLYATVADGNYRYTLTFGESGLYYGDGVSFISYFDLFGESLPVGMQTYRIETNGIDGGFSLSVNGAFLISGTGSNINFNGFEFGDGNSSGLGDANANWDYLRVSQQDMISTIPEPASFLTTAVLLSTGLLMRRRADAK